MDLAIVGGEVVTADGRGPPNVFVSEGRIAAITSERHTAAERCDAPGALVMRGMVDPHVHVMDPGDPEREDFRSGTAAAAKGGVTTVTSTRTPRP